MARNLGETSCQFCGAIPALEEAPRPITSGEAKVYYNEFCSLLVSNAVCPACGARYLAWMTEADGSKAGMVNGIFDLSYRSTFSDEPRKVDLPKWEVTLIYKRTGFWTPKSAYCLFVDKNRSEVVGTESFNDDTSLVYEIVDE